GGRLPRGGGGRPRAPPTRPPKGGRRGGGRRAGGAPAAPAPQPRAGGRGRPPRGLPLPRHGLPRPRDEETPHGPPAPPAAGRHEHGVVAARPSDQRAAAEGHRFRDREDGARGPRDEAGAVPRAARPGRPLRQDREGAAGEGARPREERPGGAAPREVAER